MDKLGWVRYSGRFPVTPQREAMARAGVKENKIYEIGKDGVASVADLLKATRRGTVIVVDGVHRLAPNWPTLIATLKAIAKKGGSVMDARSGSMVDASGAALLAEARSVYAGEERIPTSEDARERGRQGGKASSKTRRVKLGEQHKAMWKDKQYLTNPEAAAAISKALGRPVSVPTLRRRFGNSGRPAGWPNRDTKD